MTFKINLNDQKIKEILIKQNENFKSLNQKHQEFDRRLKELNNINFKTDKELIEVRNLKKRKLKIKDSMQKYIFNYKKSMMQ
ncbi:MAG: DUF465 domain-containing protein [Candidatus Aminicenantes bacterium]|nr:DUF465 domain-containing protein [Candidatus Aminicenantes bacterium]NIM83027.1 DUF465 domain-containing protein [Candidatus Aminicenantes bacterium]NIN22414.1 DUF465 domain-containing protein [Candidatus Aminicenantes bacterium]NIN46182.1 DUF465 domain-containing protein [Candidatus Aminicenantes bacterium]NIN89019.1 DUF465 domain-containing protein [Candidatus Aminicenantes bacterium]